MTNPFHLSNLVTPALDGIVRALSDRGGQSDAQKLARGNEALTLILSFLPRDAIDMTLVGQTILFNELLADGAHDVLRGMVDTMKARSVSGLVSMGRLVQGHLDRLEKRGLRPYQTKVEVPREEKPAEPAAQPEADVPVRRPRVAAEPLPESVIAEASSVTPPAAEVAPVPPEPRDPVEAMEAVGQDTPMGGRPPAEETSWLDEPFEQWVIETPFDLAAKAGRVPDGAAPAGAPTGAYAAERAKGNGAMRPGRVPHDAEPALPHIPAGYLPGRTLADAGAAAGD